MLHFFKIFAIVSFGLIANGAILDKVLSPVLGTVVPSLLSNTCTLNVDVILAVLFTKAGSLDCNICGVVAELTDTVPGVFDSKDNVASGDLIQLHCLKANTADVFVLDTSESNTDLTTKFDRNAPYSFLIHGFTDNYPGLLPLGGVIDGEAWMQRTIKTWAKTGVNVCAVNWSKLSLEKLNYFVVAQKNTIRVANFLVDVLGRLETKGVDLAKTTLAGHSLGAQICGKVGSTLKASGRTLGTIFGLDAAGPCYTFPCTIDKIDRLDASDANYVQCIHSNVGVLGQAPRCGCSDIYLNLGIVQPKAIDPVQAHFFAVAIFEWTLNANNKCFSLDGKELTGVNTPRACGVYQVRTNSNAPYCDRKINGLIGDLVSVVH